MHEVVRRGGLNIALKTLKLGKYTGKYGKERPKPSLDKFTYPYSVYFEVDRKYGAAAVTTTGGISTIFSF
jgi:hypothetical protein